MYQMLLIGGELEQYYEIDPKDSWMIAAAEKNLPIVVPAGKTVQWVTFLPAIA
jgi:deoxyhypusine synthase